MRWLENKKPFQAAYSNLSQHHEYYDCKDCAHARTHTQEAQSPPKRMGPLADSHFEGIISLITHDAKGYINVQKGSQSVNHQTGTETLITTMHPAPRIGREQRIPHLLHTKKQKSTGFNVREVPYWQSVKPTIRKLQQLSTQERKPV